MEESSIQSIHPLGKGLINDTFLVSGKTCAGVLQRINPVIFPDPVLVIRNQERLCEYFGSHQERPIRIPDLVHTREGDCCYQDESRHFWRMMNFIDHARGLSRVDNIDTAREIGGTIGAFHRQTRALPSTRLDIALPHYHDTTEYLRTFHQTCEGMENTGMLKDIGPEHEFVRKREQSAGVLQQAQEQERLPLRITHGDPKQDNMLFDQDGHVIALVDLDTVQPGLIPHDVGDCLRSCCNRRGEDPEDPAGVRFDLDISAAILRGYANAADGMLTSGEIALLYDAIRIIPFELGVRFLTDHLLGDRYFRVTGHGQNLRKARIQFALVEEIERHERELRQQIREAFSLSPSPLISA